MQSTWNSHRTPQTTYKDFPDCRGRIHCRQDSHASGTVGALQDINRENAVQKLSPRIIPRAGWSMLPGRTSHFREEISCPRRFCETAGMPEGIGQRGRWYDVRPPLSGGSKYTMIPDQVESRARNARGELLDRASTTRTVPSVAALNTRGTLCMDKS